MSDNPLTWAVAAVLAVALSTVVMTLVAAFIAAAAMEAGSDDQRL